MPIISCDSEIFINLKTQSSLPKAWFYILSDPLSALGWWGLGTAALENSQSQHCSLPAFPFSSHPPVIPLPSHGHKPLSPASSLSPNADAFLLLISFPATAFIVVTHSRFTPTLHSCVRRCEWPHCSEFYKYFLCSAEIWGSPKSRLTICFSLTQESLERGSGTTQTSFLHPNLSY